MVVIAILSVFGLPSVDLSAYVSRRLLYPSYDYDKVHAEIARHTQLRRPGLDGSSLLIGATATGFVVIHEREPGFVPSQSEATVLFFDQNQKFLRADLTSMGYRAQLRGCDILEKPKIGSFIWRSEVRPEFQPHVKVYFGLAGHRVALIRVETLQGDLLPNSFGIAHWGYGPKPQRFTKTSLLAALESPYPVVVLEALTWLGGDHLDEWKRLTPKNFNQLKSNPAVTATVTRLKGSSEPWIEQAARSVY